VGALTAAGEVGKVGLIAESIPVVDCTVGADPSTAVSANVSVVWQEASTLAIAASLAFFSASFAALAFALAAVFFLTTHYFRFFLFSTSFLRFFSFSIFFLATFLSLLNFARSALLFALFCSNTASSRTLLCARSYFNATCNRLERR
jgi:hypothetical protein